MAIITRTNGGAGAAGDLVAVIGKTPKAFGIVIKNGSAAAVDVRAQLGALGAVEAVLKAVMLNTSLLAYQVENTTSGQISVLLDGAAGFPAASDLQTAIRALGASVGATPVDVSGTVVTDVGFKLALS